MIRKNQKTTAMNIYQAGGEKMWWIQRRSSMHVMKNLSEMNYRALNNEINHSLLERFKKQQQKASAVN